MLEKKEIAALMILPLILNACSTAPKSMLTGAIAGGVVGAGVGQAHSQNSGGTAVGAVVGMGLGSLIGYLSHKDKIKTQEPKVLGDKPIEEWSPSITKPKIRSYMVPDTIDGNKYIKGHRVFVLESPGEWSKD
tara:strand:+ start:43191 stop:43589 length:399 start_codon:yes stop_codon:yes gene_type:complete